MTNRLPISCGCLLLLAGCSLTQEHPSPRLFRLEALREGEPRHASPHQLYVAPLKAAPDCDGPEFHHRISEVEYVADYYSRHLTAPAEALPDLLVHWMADSGLFADVVGSSSDLPTELFLRKGLALHARLTAFHVDRRDPARPRAVIALRVRITGRRAIAPARRDHALLADRTLSSEAPLASSTPEAAARSFNLALEGILRKLEEELAEALSDEFFLPPVEAQGGLGRL